MSGATGTRRSRVEPPVVAVFVLLLALLAAFVLYPAARVLVYPALADYLDVLSRPRWLTAARNTVVITLLSTVSATGVGFVFAFAVTRADIPARRLFRTMGILPLFAPPFMVAFAYILVFGRSGLVTHQLLGLNPDIFGWPGLWLSQTIAFFPLSMMIIQGVLEGIHPSAEQAALTLGADEPQALRTVLLPLARPGVVGAMLVVSITVLADFGNAVVIAGNYPLLATEAWFLMEGLGELKSAAVVVAALLVPTIGLFLASRAYVGRNSYATVTGRGSGMDQIATPPALKWFVVALCGLVSVVVLLTYLGIVIGGLTTAWGSDWTPTLAHWRKAFGHLDAIWGSVKIALLAGAVTALVGQLAAFLNTRDLPGRRLLGFLAVLPGALPGVFIGVGFVLAFNAPPLDLAGTLWIMVLALGFWHLPQAYQGTVAAMSQIDRSIEDAARNLGASELRLIGDMYVPLLVRNLLAAFLQSFVRSVSNVSVVVFLVAPGNVVVTFVVLQMIGGNDWAGAAALTCFLLVVTFVCIGLAGLLTGRAGRPLRGTT